MGNTKRMRAVTFTVKTTKGKREFTPVNKRAKMFATVVAGPMTLKNLKGIKEAGYRVLESPSLKAIKF